MTTSSAVATLEPRRSVLIDTAARYGMEAAAFEQTLRATVVPKDCTKEQFAAFLLVARQYDLNPITKEIYAFPTRAGGIQPIVGIDGWCNLINSNPKLDGIEFDDHLSEDGKKLDAVTCRIWRKDRAKPTTVTEYLTECIRSTDPWKQYPRRMLRHKALIQCARYAFGYAGIVDPDEAERIGVIAPSRSAAANGTDAGPPDPDNPTAKALVEPDQGAAGDAPPIDPGEAPSQGEKEFSPLTQLLDEMTELSNNREAYDWTSDNMARIKSLSGTERKTFDLQFLKRQGEFVKAAKKAD